MKAPTLPLIPVDFNSCDEDFAVRLITDDAVAAIETAGIVLFDGLRIRVTDGELTGEGDVAWRDGMWVCAVDRWLED